MSAIKALSEDMERLRAQWAGVPADARRRRVLLVAAVALGIVVTMTRSVLFERTTSYSLGVIPDARPVALFVVAFLVGAYAAFGPTQRRVHLLWFTTGALLLFQLEAASLHWFTDYQGLLTDSRVDVVGVAASALALGSIIALNGDVAAVAFAADHRARGGSAEDAEAARVALTGAGMRRAFALAGAVTGLGVLVAVAEAFLGESQAGGAFGALGVGAALLALVAWSALRAVRARA